MSKLFSFCMLLAVATACSGYTEMTLLFFNLPVRRYDFHFSFQLWLECPSAVLLYRQDYLETMGLFRAEFFFKGKPSLAPKIPSVSFKGSGRCDTKETINKERAAFLRFCD